MALVTAKDGINLFCEETGQGTPVIFVHEFAGDFRSWNLRSAISLGVTDA